MVLCNLVLAGVSMIQNPAVLAPLDRPFLFAYGTWGGKATIVDGTARIQGTPRGGAGVNADLNLKSFRGRCPSLRVRLIGANKMRSIALLLVDKDQHTGRWELPLPTSGAATITPRDGASLETPTTTEKGTLDLEHIIQWQIGGDWSSDEPINLEVSEMTLVVPTPEILSQRQARKAADAAELERQRLERLNLRSRYGTRTQNSPKWITTSFLGPDMIALEVVSGRVIRGNLQPYVPESGDHKRIDGPKLFLQRNGKDIGYLIGPKRDQLVNMEQFVGDPVLDEYANDLQQYAVSSTDDLAYATAQKPTRVDRKTKPIDAAMPSYEMVLRHRIYLSLPKPLKKGRHYTVSVRDLNVAPASSSFVFDPSKVQSEAVRVNQIGFRPDDPLKRAYLSVWLGSGGARSYDVGTKFDVKDVKTGKIAFSGKTTLGLAADGTESLWRKTGNFSKTAIYRMDFAMLRTPGVYRVVVDGVGCSEPFPIAEDAWTHAFKIQMRGLLNNRSGIALGPPYTKFVKPRDFYPGDGVSITQSNYCVLDGGGENPKLAAMDTGVPVPNAWGGYQDAGDWNPRRVTHLKVTMAHLELMRLFPEKFSTLAWNIPKDTKAPDTLNEALFELSCFRRLQKPDGGIPFGIESDGDPIEGEVSWLQSMKAYVFAPDPVSCWVYASVAMPFSELMRRYEPKIADEYKASAIKAMEWAELNTSKFRSRIDWTGWDWRNLAAVRCYAATSDPRWHRVFMENSVLKEAEPNLFLYGKSVQEEAAFTYATLPKPIGDTATKQKAVAAIERQARMAIEYAAGNGWNLTTSDPGKPMFLGFFSTANAESLIRAHYLTHKPEYLSGIIQSTLFCGGANPSGVTYTSGLGTKSVVPFKIDYRLTGQAPPEGLTVYGNCDYLNWPDNSFFTWPIKWHVSRVAIPDAYAWPIPEALFETFLYPAQLEYTVDAWAPNILTWGYLAARK